jgi:hypothetical protein
MTARARALTLLAVLGFVGLLLWTTLAAQRVECTATVEFRGARSTGTASAADSGDAAREARTAACGPVTASMDDRIACANTRPVIQRCRSL